MECYRRQAGPQILQPSDAPSRTRKITRRGDVIYSCVRPYLLNVAVIDEDFDPLPIASTAFAVLDGYGLVLPRYLWIVLRSSFAVSSVEESMRGQAYPAINDADFALLPFPLPPLAEQRRIVARVEALMALCDHLERARAEREAARDRLTAATLARLNSPQPETFRDDARFALGALPTFTTRVEHLVRLRKTISNLATLGKLVPQQANDIPVTLPQAAADSPSVPLPPNWQFARLKYLLAEDTRNGYGRSPDGATDGVPILRISAGTTRRDGIVAEEDFRLISGITPELRQQYALRPGDLLACRFNGNKSFVGRFAIFKDHLGIRGPFKTRSWILQTHPARVAHPFVVSWSNRERVHLPGRRGRFRNGR